MRKTLILGLAAGYHGDDLRPFLLSLKRSGFAGTCVLFTSPTTRDVERIAACGARAVPFERPEQYAHVPYNAWRYFLYREFLKKASKRYERILLTDTRDVVFQADPFSCDWPEGINAVLEGETARIGVCPHTTFWMREHLGEAVTEAHAGRPISCSGTTVADHEAMAAYLDALCAALLPFTPAPRMAGYDQAVHNHLLHAGLVPKATLHENGFPVLTLGNTPDEPAVRGDVALGPNWETPLIVHQYDRKPALFRRIRAMYARSMPESS